MYKCIVIDDELHAIEGLKGYIAAMPELSLVNTYSDALQALQSISKNEAVDLIFIDVDMPKINGIELSKVIRNKTDRLIFTTAHTKYAFDAFEVAADAYLLKPYSLAKFLTTVNKVLTEIKKNESTKADDFFFVKSKGEDLKIVKVRYDDIIAIESKQNYVMIHTKERNILTYMSLTEMLKLLKDLPGFVQLHRSFLVNQEHIESITGNAIYMANGLQITVGESYRKDFNLFVGEKLMKAGKRD
jgi:DNA-binding LytR/AlgR family response regulator